MLVKAEEQKNVVGLVRTLFPYLSNVPDIEIAKAVALAKEMGLNPIKKECHFIPFKDRLQVVVSYTEYIKRAEASNKLDGWDVKIDDKCESATITIYRKDWEKPFTWTVYKQEAYKETESWKKMPCFMLRKVAIAQGFRLAFPNETADLPYEEAEITPITETMEHTMEHTKEHIRELERTITDKQRKRLFAIAKEHGVTEEEVKEIIQRYGYESTKDILMKDYEKIIAEIEQQAEKEPDWTEYEEE